LRLPRSAHLWLPGYAATLAKSWRKKLRGERPARVWLAFADHYEPLWGTKSEEIARKRVAEFSLGWTAIASEFCDSAGRPPRYTFFYPEEQYRPELLEPLERMARAGIADVEIHIHHDGEGETDFINRIVRFKKILSERHGLLRTHNGEIVFGFIHGNWALDNSRPDGRYCGLNNEITLLLELGCYADFTLPSAPFATQTRMVNTIYWAEDDPTRPKSHDTGIPVENAGTERADRLMMIPGPLGLRLAFWRRGERLIPRLETGELAHYNSPTPSRVRLWLDLAPRVGGDVFIKLHTHGAPESNSAMLLRSGLRRTLELVLAEAGRRGQEVYFVSAWEMRQAVDAARCGSNPAAALSARTLR
jgi:hypothetical protein